MTLPTSASLPNQELEKMLILISWPCIFAKKNLQLWFHSGFAERVNNERNKRDLFFSCWYGNSVGCY